MFWSPRCLLFLHSTLLYSTLLFSTLLYSTLLYSTLLYSTLPAPFSLSIMCFIITLNNFFIPYHRSRFHLIGAEGKALVEEGETRTRQAASEVRVLRSNAGNINDQLLVQSLRTYNSTLSLHFLTHSIYKCLSSPSITISISTAHALILILCLKSLLSVVSILFSI